MDQWNDLSEETWNVVCADMDEIGAVDRSSVFRDTQTGSGTIFNIPEMVRISAVGKKNSQKYGVTLETFEVTVIGLAEVAFSPASQTIVALMEHIMQEVLKPAGNDDFIRFRIESGWLSFPIWTPLMKKSQLTVERWMDEVEQDLNSQ